MMRRYINQHRINRSTSKVLLAKTAMTAQSVADSHSTNPETLFVRELRYDQRADQQRTNVVRKVGIR